MKMMLSTKPISSPGRTKKFPPPLMRFLRTNVGSRSRGRSRSSPMFIWKKNTAVETQEPSSPKVTCMGQVRVRRSSKQAAAGRPGRTRRAGASTRRRCKWLRNALFCHRITWKRKPVSFRPAWRKWVLFFRQAFRGRVEIREDSPRVETMFGNRSEFSEQEDDKMEEDEEEKVKVFVSNSTSPPKNALLLTRCRSAPYRSSSLACRFWGSPLGIEETERGDQGNREEQAEPEKPTSVRESISDEESIRESISDEESRICPEAEGKSEFSKGSVRERLIETANVEDLKAGEAADSVRPLILTRCKSEPARTGEKLDPEMNSWKQRRLGDLGLADSR